MVDLVLAIAHHLLIFALFGVLMAELMLVKPGIDAAGLSKVARIDGGYGGIATLVVIVGFARAVFAAKGWDYYLHNGFFWAKSRPSRPSALCPFRRRSSSSGRGGQASPRQKISGASAASCTWRRASSPCC